MCVFKAKARHWLAISLMLFMGLCFAWTDADLHDPVAIALSKEFPADSIQTREQAENALNVVMQAEYKADQIFDRAKHDCVHRFFVTRCLDNAREVQLDMNRVITRIRFEAHTWQRYADAQDKMLHIIQNNKEAQLDLNQRQVDLEESEDEEYKPLAPAKPRNHTSPASAEIDWEKRLKQEQKSLHQTEERINDANENALKKAADKGSNIQKRAERRKKLDEAEQRRLHPSDDN